MKALLKLLFPPKCVLCRELLAQGERDICEECRIFGPDYPNRKKGTHFLDSFAAVWYYEGNVRKSILRYKFYHARHYAPAFGRILGEKILEVYPEGFDTLSWVPVSPLRKLTRGYDQAALLAKAVGSAVGMTPVQLLKKIRHNRPQSGISGEAKRRANVLGAYRVRSGADVAGKRILLLDDVFTTGSTAGECARMLKLAGAKEVHCAVLAARK
ncbi:MAG: ComF family protein [Oscillospiraceae bacterium]|nr:ComF family protein [Oscillospiraceae bacterium]